MKRCPLLIAAWLLAATQPLFAQQQQSVGPLNCWDSLSPADTIRLAFAIHAEEHRIWRTSNPADLSIDYLTSVAEAIAARISVPPRVESRAFTLHQGVDSTVEFAVREISASVTFKPGPDGRIGSVHLYGVGASPAWEQALAQAVIDADAAGDSVALQFIIDESGKVETDRVSLVTARYADFVTAIANTLPKMRFQPARIGACRVRSVVSQTFVFRMSP